jgi:hypothetical protein
MLDNSYPIGYLDMPSFIALVPLNHERRLPACGYDAWLRRLAAMMSPLVGTSFSGTRALNDTIAPEAS